MADENSAPLVKSRFKTVSKEQKEKILNNSKAQNTNKATEQWISVLKKYLEEKNLKQLDQISDGELPAILSDFYTEVKKKDRTPPKKSKKSKLALKPKLLESDEYKTSSLKCIRAALNRYFRRERCLDIISDKRFIAANDMFKGVTKVAREEGRGFVEHKETITEADFQKLKEYFSKNMAGPANGRSLQEIVLFNVIYQMGRRGRENLRPMTKNTFAVSIDSEGKKYIHQVTDELTKNYTEASSEKANQARIYEQPGTIKFVSMSYFLIKTQLIQNIKPVYKLKIALVFVCSFGHRPGSML